jgi:hypothetical protein
MSETKPAAEGGDAAGMTKRDLFLGLVQSFQMAAMQQMGRIPNPSTGQVERDLGHARLSIAMLEMIQERTTGNLTMEEVRFLDHILTEVRMSYVSEAARASGGGATAPGAGGATAPGGDPPGAGGATGS